MGQKYSTAIIFGAKAFHAITIQSIGFWCQILKKTYFPNYFPFSSLFLCQTTPQFWENSCLEPNQFRAFEAAEPLTFLFLYLLIISFKNIYSLEFTHTKT
jgi:hypothetical protein